MTKQPKISVVIPVYNREGTLNRAIWSVLNQNFSYEYEIIIIDDGSTDSSVSLINNLGVPKIRLIQQENSGVSAARNRGIKEAKSKFIAFLDSDDEWKPDFLSIIWKMTKKFPEAGAYTTCYYLKYPDGKIIKANIKKVLQNKSEGLLDNYFSSAMNGNGPVCSSAVCVPKQIFVELGGFPEGIHMQEDLQMWVKIALKYPIAFSPQPASIYYKESANSACNIKIPKREDMIFADTINRAITDSTLKGQQAHDALCYVNKYAFQNAFKAIVANNRKAGHEILSLVTPITFKEKIKLFTLLLLSSIPNVITYKIWTLGKSLKSITRKSVQH